MSIVWYSHKRKKLKRKLGKLTQKGLIELRSHHEV